MFFRRKRGVEWSFFTAVEVVLSMIIILVFYNSAVTIGKNIEWEKRYLAADLALTIDTAYAVPGNLLYMYVPQTIMEKGLEKNRLVLSIVYGWMLKGVPGAIVGYYFGSKPQPIGLIPIDITTSTIQVVNGVVAISTPRIVDAVAMPGATAAQAFAPAQTQPEAYLPNPPFLALTKIDEEIKITSVLERPPAAPPKKPLPLAKGDVLPAAEKTPSPAPLCALLKDGTCDPACSDTDLDCQCGNNQCEPYENHDTCPADCKPRQTYLCAIASDNICTTDCVGTDIDCTVTSFINKAVEHYEKDEQFYSRFMAALSAAILALSGVSLWLLHRIYKMKAGEL